MEIRYTAGRPRLSGLRTAENGAAWLVFDPLAGFDFVLHGFSTRLGGVSSGIYASMNLAWNRGDDRQNVLRNYECMGEALGIPVENMVHAHQTHTSNILRAGKEHRGMGILRERSFHDIDGLITDEPGLCLVTGHADCIPLYFVDPVHSAIGLAHAGWRGTAGNIAGKMTAAMKAAFGTKPEDLTVLAGPGICGSCYEVGPEVAEVLPDSAVPRPGREGEKYLLDLHDANRRFLLSAGVPEEQIFLSDVCTMENPDLIFSHRATKGQRGGSAAFLAIRG